MNVLSDHTIALLSEPAVKVAIDRVLSTGEPATAQTSEGPMVFRRLDESKSHYSLLYRFLTFDWLRRLWRS